MDSKEREYFQALNRDRNDSADTFEKPSTREMWKSIVEKYSDQAHFIYELIQNADDASATSARFILEKNRLIFAHNGTRLFSISNPESEDIDKENNELGDINAITGIAFSNKKSQENKIGKFGVGFKSVFQYTKTPYIYDKNFKFKITRYIVPDLIESDFPFRKSNETLFVFPFNREDLTQEEAYQDIEAKLNQLSYPILFLSNLEEISFTIHNAKGSYQKEIIESREIGDTLAQKICFKQKSKTQKKYVNQHLWMFSRITNGLKYSVAFLLNENDELMPVVEPAYCFFPTKENTNLKFLIHAPFLLTDSREGIRANIGHNKKMIGLLSKLAADSILYLKDIGLSYSKKMITDDIFKIIPIKESEFTKLDDISKISFLPFYTEIKTMFQTQEILPTKDGYARKENAYWATVLPLIEIFDEKRLSFLLNKQDSKWVFTTLGSENTKYANSEYYHYMSSLINDTLSEDSFLEDRFNSARINASFIEKQELDWLHKFYKWLFETERRTNLAKKLPIFLDQYSNAVCAFDNNNHLVLFLKAEGIEGYSVIREDLLDNDVTREFIKKIGIIEPSKRDYIYNIVLPQYKDGEDIETDPHFKLFFNYYCQCSLSEVEEFINEIKNYEFITYYSKDDSEFYRGRASEVYMPSKELLEYFETKPSTKFIAFEEYKQLVENNEEVLRDFLVKLGINTKVKFYDRELKEKEIASREELPRPHSSSRRAEPRYIEREIDGYNQIIEYIQKEKSVEKSITLWDILIGIISSFGSLDDILVGKCEYFFRSLSIEVYTPLIVQKLKNMAWLFDKQNNLVSPNNLSADMLLDRYNMESKEAVELMKFLEIKKVYPQDMLENESLSEIQKNDIAFARRVKEIGYSFEDIIKLIEEDKLKKLQNNLMGDLLTINSSNEKENRNANAFNHLDNFFGIDNSQSKNELKKPTFENFSDVTMDIIKKTHSISGKKIELLKYETNELDADEYMPVSVNFKHRVELEKQRTAKIIDEIAYTEELQNRALNSSKYSYQWFQSLLEMESLNANTNRMDSGEIMLIFSKVELEEGTQRTLVLKQPNRYIPQFMEELADIHLMLQVGDSSRKIAVEVASVKSYTLRAKMKSHIDIADLDLTKVTEAKIEAKSPVFLLEELRKRFDQLNYPDDYNMRDHLPENIEFIFGAPGTGKTTYLAKNIIMDLVKQYKELKILVLTPTNKAADVLVTRLMDRMGDDYSYYDWLVRFGTTTDESIEQSPIYRNKAFDIRNLKKKVVVTTIARFPYDYFMPDGARLYLNALEWDYIIIDEASMIPLANIVYPLYKKTPKKFIIAGDPFQIEPVTSVDLWKNENIYTMVKLDSFKKQNTVPHKYKVKLLTTQYRSLPSIGKIFSHFAYEGLLQHSRTEDNIKKLNIEEKFDIKPLNIIKFPVSKYESVYRSKRLKQSSSYQIYSALFSYEFALYLSNLISNANSGEFFKIGIIAPYKAQADVIDKLFATADIAEGIDIQVGTIHGFQGDECDIIFVVLNTPPSISSNKEMFLNKINIINVSISRAKDYLFLIMPDDDTEGIENLRLVKVVENLFKLNGSNEYKSQELEYHIFKNSNYLEDNVFATGHQSVNVYVEPEKKYEIRSEDSAIDIQIH